MRSLHQTPPADRRWLPNHLAVISHDQQLHWAIETALSSDGSQLRLSYATTVLALIEALQQTPCNVRTVIFRPPSTQCKKVQKALDEACRLFKGATIILITDALGGDERATIFPRVTEYGAIVDYLRKNVFPKYRY